MLEIAIPASEMWDETNECFIQTKSCVLKLEHSLLSISKWEAKWQKPFLSKKAKTGEETLDYIRCMTISPKVPLSTYMALTESDFRKITDYVGSPMTATTFRKTNEPPSHEIVTSELIYYWMVAFQIPFECEKWHLNRLLTLIRICGIKNKPPKKMNKSQLLHHHASINAARRAKHAHK